MLATLPIVGDKPQRGVRIVLERAPGREPPWAYIGAAFTPVAEHPLSARVDADGTVHIDASGAPLELAERARLILRAAFKQAAAASEPPARRIVRWRDT
jgi:hypothetical protein